MERTAEYIRKTKETDIKINLNIDGTGKAEIDTGIGFFDHMLEGFARHGFFDLDVKVEGDLAVDCHHTIEDTGIVLGNAIRKALKNKNNLLFGINFSDDLSVIRPQIESWNSVLAAEGLNVTYGRLKYFSLLETIASQLYNELSGGENLTLKYYSSIFDSTELKCEEINSLYNEYLERLNNSFQRELKMRYTVLGVHRDDMNLYIDNNDVKEFGSQGQQRSTALALKLAEAEIIRQKDETPIMILDDVLSELDAGRQRFVLNHIINSQVFITCCNINDVKELKNGKVWKVENGIFTEE